MGTRNLTIVVSNGKTKVAQYGQWDGYPSGQGETALKFVKHHSLVEFKEKLKKVRFATKKDKKEREEYLLSIGVKDGWINMEQSAKYNEKYSLDSRDHGADILNLIFDSVEKEIVLQNTLSFAADSLFCEWAYVIDLDKNTFEVYKGFNKEPLTESDRFFHLQKDKEEYKPVKLLKSYPLPDLPTVEQLISECEEKEEVEN